MTLPPPSTNASINKSKVTISLKQPHERPSTSYFSDYEKRYPLPQTLAKQYDENLRKKRLKESLMASQLVDTT